MQHSNTAGCILLKFYIKPQHSDTYVFGYSRCILSKFYIKPQQIIGALIIQIVVSYRNSTSNHNNVAAGFVPAWLYLIEILHQTTTVYNYYLNQQSCILSKFYIKPQPLCVSSTTRRCCILSKFYIKPQLPAHLLKYTRCCILSKFYIKPQLQHCGEMCSFRCILSKFYIKPQLWS